MYEFYVFYSNMKSFSFLLLTVCAFILVLHSCIQAPDFPDEPVIEFMGMSSQSMSQGALNQDSIKVFFSFTDGDGDLGIPLSERKPGNFDLFVIDTRTNNLQDKFYLPYVPPKGATNGISGTAEVVLYNTCCIYQDGSSTCEPNEAEPTNELQYEIYIKDRSGNESNRILTSTINLVCN